jgi:hypothetical protein
VTTFDPYAPSRDTTEGKVFSVTGGDWDALVQEIGATNVLSSTWVLSTLQLTEYFVSF